MYYLLVKLDKKIREKSVLAVYGFACQSARNLYQETCGKPTDEVVISKHPLVKDMIKRAKNCYPDFDAQTAVQFYLEDKKRFFKKEYHGRLTIYSEDKNK